MPSWLKWAPRAFPSFSECGKEGNPRGGHDPLLWSERSTAQPAG